MIIHINNMKIFIQGIKLHSKIDINQFKEILDKINNEERVVQLIDANAVASLHHLISAILRTERAFLSKRNISHKKHVELLLRLCGTRQISNAIEIAGLKNNITNILLVCYGKDAQLYFESIIKMIDGDFNDNIFLIDENKRQFLIKIYNLRPNISSEEISKYVLFKSALIEIET